MEERLTEGLRALGKLIDPLDWDLCERRDKDRRTLFPDSAADEDMREVTEAFGAVDGCGRCWVSSSESCAIGVVNAVLLFLLNNEVFLLKIEGPTGSELCGGGSGIPGMGQ